MNPRFAFAALLLLLAGCSSNQPKGDSAPAAKKEDAKVETPQEADRITGRDAFQKLYLAARNWAPDSRPVKLESRPRPGEPRDGRAAVWVGTFASTQRGMLRSFMWSGAVGENAPEPGITPGSQDTFSPGNASTQPFDAAYLRADTDQALSVAEKRAPAAARKDKESPVKFQLYNDTAKQRLLWRVIYGQSESSARGIVDVSARDGGFVRVGK